MWGAEEPLPKGGSCILSSINLSEFVNNAFTDKSNFNYDEFESVLKIVVKAMNDILDEGLPLHPLQEQRDSVRDWRQIGIGVMGIADMLVKMQLQYGSEESIKLCNDISAFMSDKVMYYSAMLAKEHGAYPKCNKELLLSNNFLLYNASNETKMAVAEYGLRNSQLLTIAPTGSISTMIGVSGGIEPFFAFHYTRKTESLHGKDVYYDVPTKTVGEYMRLNGIEKESDLPDYFVESKDIDYHNRIEMQSVWQRHIDASISSTVNLPNSTTKDQVFDLYLYAAEKGLKGITVYRDGCDREAILTTKKENEEETEKFQLDYIVPISRSKIGKTIGTTNKFKTACGNLYITINRDDDGNIVETFVNVSKNGICKSNIDGISRMISVALRSGTMVEEVIDQLKGINCPACTRALSKGERLDGISCPDIIARTIQSEYDSDEIYIKKTKRGKGRKRQQVDKDKSKSNVEETIVAQCPDCGAPLEFTGGCCVCTNCGYSKCG